MFNSIQLLGEEKLGHTILQLHSADSRNSTVDPHVVTDQVRCFDCRYNLSVDSDIRAGETKRLIDCRKTLRVVPGTSRLNATS